MITLLVDVAQQPWWAPVLQTAVGGGLAILGAFLATWWSAILKNDTERRQVAAAFAGDISGLHSVLAAREYESLLAVSITSVLPIPSTPPPNPSVASGLRMPWINPLPIRDSHFRLFDKNVDRLGSLPPMVAREIAEMYAKLRTVVVELEQLEKGIPKTLLYDKAIAAFANRVAQSLRDCDAKAGTLTIALEKEAKQGLAEILFKSN